jgi:hypothetical protein
MDDITPAWYTDELFPSSVCPPSFGATEFWGHRVLGPQSFGATELWGHRVFGPQSFGAHIVLKTRFFFEKVFFFKTRSGEPLSPCSVDLISLLSDLFTKTIQQECVN